MKAHLVSTLFLLLTFQADLTRPLDADEAPKRILFIAGEPSHGWNKHEFPAGCELLAKCLNESGLNLEASVQLGWPEDADAINEADTIVIYSDGNEDHVALGKELILEELYGQGTHFAILHYALEPGEPKLEAFLHKSIGAYFQVDYSVNPVWTLENPELSDHPVNRGISKFQLEDEWYYHLRFPPPLGATPLLKTVPPVDSLGEDGPRSGNPNVREALAKGIAQTLAWTKTGENGQRGFGFTGGHFHYNWNDENFRKLVLNGIAWIAGFDIPENGIQSKITPIVVHQSIEHAIALGDAEDLQRYLANDPELLNKPGRGSYTPLHQSILRKKTELVTILLALGADPNVTTKSKQTALHVAISRSDIEASKATIAAGADRALRDGDGWTPLHLAAAKNKLELAALLLDSGADITLLSDAGGTPLHEASVSGSPELVQLLLDRGADPSVVSKTGKTALDHAIEFKNDPVAEILRNAH